MKPVPFLTLAALGAAGPAAGQATATPEAGGGPLALLGVGAVLAALVAVGAIARAFDVRRRHESEAAALQSRVSDALMTDPTLAPFTLTPTARVPGWRGTPVRIEIAGQVPDEALRERALRTVRREAARVRPDVVVEDRVGVVPALARKAA